MDICEPHRKHLLLHRFYCYRRCLEMGLLHCSLSICCGLVYRGVSSQWVYMSQYEIFQAWSCYWLRRTRWDSSVMHLTFMAEKEILGYVFLQVPSFSLPVNIPPVRNMSQSPHNQGLVEETYSLSQYQGAQYNPTWTGKQLYWYIYIYNVRNMYSILHS
jgi:hypothetical protein